MYEDWFDEYRMLHLRNPPDRSDNGMLFTVEYNFLSELLGEEPRIDAFNFMVYAHQISKGVYSQTPWNKTDPASHDNITAMVAYSYYHDLRPHKTLKIWGKFWHPKELIFYCFCRRRWYDYWAFPMLPILSLLMFMSFFRKYKFRLVNRRDNIIKSTLLEFIESIKDTWKFGTPNPDIKKMPQTDGKKIGWVRCQGTMHKSFTMRLTYKICNFIMKKFSIYSMIGNGHWYRLFRQYYTESGDSHPINIISKKLYFYGVHK